jgi:hypothetical protein
MNTISLLVLSRPDYTRQVIEALSGCDGLSKYVLSVFSQEPCVPETIATVRDATAKLAIPVVVVTEYVQPVRHIAHGPLAASAQCAASTLRSLEHGFATGADFLIHLEDDIVPARDFLRYMEWAAYKFAERADVFTVSAYNRQVEPVAPSLHYAWGIRPAFTSWGWGTWRDRFVEMQGQWTRYEWPHAGWDDHLHHNLRRGRGEIYPALSRVQNIGASGGVHVPSEAWHHAHHHVPHWAGNATLTPGEFGRTTGAVPAPHGPLSMR